MKVWKFAISFLLLALCQYDTSAQVIKVVSAADKSVLPYATITNRSRSSIISCNDQGAAHLVIQKGDTLSISYIGYKTASVQYNGDDVQIIQLIPKQALLPTVTVRSCKKIKELTLSNFIEIKKAKDKRVPLGDFGGVIWTKGTITTAKVAVRINPSNQNGFLRDFSFWVEKQSEAPMSSILNPLIIGIYQVSDSAFLPGELLVDKPIFYFPKKQGKQVINLDTLSIYIPPNGIYISLQYVMNDTYEWKQFFWHTDSLGVRVIDTVVYRYGGLIKGLRTKGFDFVWYDGVKEQWFSVGGRSISNDDFHSSIKCEATIKVCEDLRTTSAAPNMNCVKNQIIFQGFCEQ